VGPDPGQRALDACAAPGGKLTHLLETFPDLGVQALEVDPSRGRLISENLERLHLSAEVSITDAADLERWWDGRPFDLVVLDAPCTATGVVRRHPDIKVLRRSSDADRLAGVQAKLLERLWATVGAGGRLIYVTCSILAAENQDQIAAFLERTPDARADRVELPVGQPLQPGWQILPSRDGGDGFYYAVVRRVG
jgi:16S rRNA (cytosine967-C5)-methyltransferase